MALQVNPTPVTSTTPHRCWFESRLFHFRPNSLPVQEKQQQMAHMFGTCHPHQRSRWNYWLLASTIPRNDVGRHLGSAPTDGKSICLSPSLCNSFKIKKKKKHPYTTRLLPTASKENKNHNIPVVKQKKDTHYPINAKEGNTLYRSILTFLITVVGGWQVEQGGGRERNEEISLMYEEGRLNQDLIAHLPHFSDCSKIPDKRDNTEASNYKF